MNKLYTNNIFLEPTLENEVLQILSSFKKSSPGHDDIAIKVLKAVKNVIISPLIHICKLSLEIGMFQDQCKIANRAVVILKKGLKIRVTPTGGITNHKLLFLDENYPLFPKIMVVETEIMCIMP
jgi:hypothetical protein